MPPASQKLYDWLMRRNVPGNTQQFDKEDFDRYCLKVGRDPFCVKWFVNCISKLISTGLLLVERRYRGYGYQVRVYHPWQIGENQNSQKSNQNSQKSTSNTDSAVDSCIYSKISTNNVEKIVVDRKKQAKLKNQLQQTKAGVESELQESKPKIIRRKFQGQEDDWGELSSPAVEQNVNKEGEERNREIEPQLEDKGVNSDDNPELVQEVKSDVIEPELATEEEGKNSADNPELVQEVKPDAIEPELATEEEEEIREVERPIINHKVVNTLIKEELNNTEKRFLNQLENLGAIVNETLIRVIQVTDTEKIQRSIEYIKRQKRSTYISNVAGYFVQCIKQDFGAKQEIDIRKVKEKDLPALFNQWYELAKKLGNATDKKKEFGEYWVKLSGRWEKWIDAIDRGMTIEYLKKTLKYYADTYGNKI